MSIDLRDLYQDTILDHSRHPRNFGRLEPCDHRADGNNPLCGDRVTVFMRIEGGRIADLSFEARGCAISLASASMMTELVKGRTVAEAQAIFERFREIVTRKGPVDADELDRLDGLAALVGVRQFPMRVKCATLPWHTMVAAVEGSQEEVRTE
jgi:nitrogen fixation protein NifU and related proteins